MKKLIYAENITESRELGDKAIMVAGQPYIKITDLVKYIDNLPAVPLTYTRDRYKINIPIEKLIPPKRKLELSKEEINRLSLKIEKQGLFKEITVVDAGCGMYEILYEVNNFYALSQMSKEKRDKLYPDGIPCIVLTNYNGEDIIITKFPCERNGYPQRF